MSAARPTDRAAHEVRCDLCGFAYDPGEARGACSTCPLGASCRVACCPRCGYAAPVPEGSTLVRLFDWIFTRRQVP